MFALLVKKNVTAKNLIIAKKNKKYLGKKQLRRYYCRFTNKPGAECVINSELFLFFIYMVYIIYRVIYQGLSTPFLL